MKFLKKIISLFLILVVLSLIMSLIYPLGYKEYINEYALEYEVDPFLIAAVINVESKYNKNAISSKDAKGLMQIGPKTGEWISEILDIDSYNENLLFDPKINIMFGSWYLNQLKKDFNNDLDLVLAAYNAGSGNVTKWLGDKSYSEDGDSLDYIPFKETEDYLKRVNLNYKIYKLLYRKRITSSNNLGEKYIEILSKIRLYLKNN